MLLSSCATIEVSPEIAYINPDLDKYVRIFVQEASKRGVEVSVDDLNVNFSDQIEVKGTPDAIGACYTGGDISQVKILSSSWEFSDEIEREALMSHELGHCVLFRLHCNALNSKKRPYSLMHSNSIVDQYFKEYRTYYYDELFNPHKKCK